MHYDRAWAESDFRTGQQQDYLLFWGHQPSKDGRIAASCLSQWWPSPFVVESVVYPTAEHWMMAGKARLFGDMEVAQKIVATNSPKDVKALGRKVRDFDADRWDSVKRSVVEEGSYHKFSQNTELRAFLLSTGDDVLVEASPVDDIWGIGLAPEDPKARDPALWRGQNLLGFALMVARDRLRGM